METRKGPSALLKVIQGDRLGYATRRQLDTQGMGPFKRVKWLPWVPRREGTKCQNTYFFQVLSNRGETMVETKMDQVMHDPHIWLDPG